MVVVVAGLAADQGMSNREFYFYLTSCYIAGIITSYIDSAEKHEGSVFPLRCDRIEYEGVEVSRWDG